MLLSIYTRSLNQEFYLYYRNHKISSMGDTPLSPLSRQDPPPCALHGHLRLLLRSQRERWDYAIFWKASRAAADGCLVLSWGAGYYHGDDGCTPPNSKLDSLEPEWFYMASITRSFVSADDLVFRAHITASSIWLVGHQQLSLCWSERAKEAQLHGVGTLVLIPVSFGVVELGSSGLIKENWSLINLITTSFDPRDRKRGPASPVPLDSDDSKGPKFQKSVSSSPEPRDSDDSRSFIGMPDLPLPRKTARDATNRTGKSRANHVEAEKRRREQFNQRFYALRSVVPNVSRMDKASLLADAIEYINQLKSTVTSLEAKCTRLSETCNVRSTSNTKSVTTQSSIHGAYGPKVEVEVKISGPEATVRVESSSNHPCARAMNALRDMELEVSRASALEMENVMFQEIVIRVPHGLYSEEALKRTIASKMEAD